MDGTTQLLESDRRYLVHPLHHPDDHRQPLVVVEGKGAILRDAEGREYIDGLSGLWNVNVGHGRGELADAAAAQMRRIAFASAYIGATNEPAVRLAEKIVGHAYPSSAAVYFTTAGAESNESSFKFARYYWKVKDQPQKTKIISRIHAYHGVTMAAMSATGMAAYHKMFGPLVPGFIQVAPPYAYRWTGNEEPGVGAADAVEKRDPRRGPRHRGGGHRRAGDGGGRRYRAAAVLFPAAARNLRPPRCTADRRRGDHRFWPHRQMVRARALGRRAGSRLLRQGGDQRLSAVGRRDRVEARARGDRERAGRPQIHACRDLFRPSGLLCGRLAQCRDHRKRGARRARGGNGPQAARRARGACATCRSSAMSAGSA